MARAKVAASPAHLASFLETLAGRPFADGTADCLMTGADWIVLNGRPDPAAPWRGRYRTPMGRERLLRRLGGIEAAMRDGAARAGLTETETPADGDVGLIIVDGRAMGAIRVGALWAGQGDGLVVQQADAVVRAWRI